MPSPVRAHMPATAHRVRQTWGGGWTPPMKRAVSSSAMNSTQRGKSSTAGGRRISRAVSSVGPRVTYGETA
jgi:hypothetical protein